MELLIMSNLTNPKWWAAATVRALKTMAQAAIASIGTSAMVSTVDWKVVLSTSLLSGLLSYLTSIAGLPEVDQEKLPEGQTK